MNPMIKHSGPPPRTPGVPGSPATTGASRSHRLGFSLTELMIAVVVLMIVIIATSKIFGTASDVAGIGEATHDILQEAAAIEQQIRRDFSRLSYDGFFAIESHAVRNDVNAGGPLLNPNLPPFETIRSDQLVFFTTGVINTRNYNVSAFSGFTNSRSQQSTAARVYYGHSFQLPDAPLGWNPAQDWWPWLMGPLPMLNQAGAPAGNFEVPLIPPQRWMLSRQATLLADDGGFSDDYFGADNSAESIWDARLRNGRVDIAASTIGSVRSTILNALPANWVTQSNFIGNAIFYPRAERVPPVDSSSGTNPDFVRREDFALTTSTLSSACSQFIVEWTYHDRVGEARANNGDFIEGVVVDPVFDQPWFGYRDPSIVGDRRINPDPDRGVFLYQDWVLSGRGALGVNAFAIERPVLIGGGLTTYKAFFGYNRDNPNMDFLADTPDVDDGYTPWPSAVRITMTLHDQNGRLENGRTYQFIVELPRQNP